MSKILHLDSSLQDHNSASRRMSAAIVARLRGAEVGAELIYRDLAANPFPHLSGPVFATFTGPADVTTLTPSEQEDAAESARALAEFVAADTIVIGVAFYNYSIPSQLKAWIDRVVVAGKTFAFGAAGPVGLAAGKRVVVAIARGGVYAAGSPFEHREHAERYLRDILALVGIEDLEVIVAEGLAFGPEANTAAMERALGNIEALPMAFG